jgi:DNA-binding NtrC family response regulator
VAKLMPGSKVLIVDDEQIFADTLAQIFRNEGFDCRAVYSAEQALETIAEWEPALSIIDVMLPGMNGIDLVILLKATHPSMGVMMISGQVATGGLVEKAAKEGHEFSILPKPFPVPELLSNASRILAGIIAPLPPNSPLAN